MRIGIRTVSTIVLGLFVAVGCGGGGGGAGSAEAPTTAASAPTSDGTAASAGIEPTAPAATPQPAGGGPAAGVCELVTADELAQIFGVPSVTTTVLAGPPDNCIVASAEGDPLAAWSLTTAQATLLFDAFASDPASVEVSGIGDKAAIVQNTGLLVLKGDALAVISISAGADVSEDEGTELAKQIGAIAAGRM